MKRFLSLVLAFVFVMGICASAPFTITANAANLVNGDFEYRLINNDTEVEITGYVGSGGDVYIPNQIGGKKVTSIADSVFNGNTTITYVWMSDFVEMINEYAFEGCTGLKNVDFGSGVKTIGVEAFEGCTSLEVVNLPDSLETLNKYNYGSGVFSNCTSLKSVTIGNGLKEIKERSFENCTSLETIVFGANIQSDVTDGDIEGIDYNVFKGCTSLKNVYFLGNTAPSIDESNTELMSATWHYLPNATGFTQGSVSKTYKTVTFDGNGGSTLINDVETASYTKYADNGRVSTPINPTREGYTFLGWYLTKDGTGEKVNFNTYNVTANTTFYAKWQINTYRIYFDPRGGSVSLGGKDVVYGQQIGTLPTPTLKGDTFNGWYLGMNSSGPCYTATTKMPAKDIILYAGWATNDNATTVIFDTEGGSFIAPVSVTFGSKVSKPADPTRAGHRFIGWYKDANHSEKFDFNTDVIEANTTIYALWQHNHTSSNWVTIKNPTCKDEGFKQKLCTICSAVLEMQMIPTSSHNAVNGNSKDIHSKCGTCGTVISSTHSFTKSVVKAATCTQAGSNKFT